MNSTPHIGGHMANITCRDCGRSFDPDVKARTHKGGYRNQCLSCSVASGDADQKYLGRPGATAKGANIEIFRTNLETVKAVIQQEGRVGFTANLGLGSPAAVQKFEEGRG
jgi:hypothetical protein